MKKFLTLFSSLALITTSTSIVIACGKMKDDTNYDVTYLDFRKSADYSNGQVYNELQDTIKGIKRFLLLEDILADQDKFVKNRDNFKILDFWYGLFAKTISLQLISFEKGLDIVKQGDNYKLENFSMDPLNEKVVAKSVWNLQWFGESVEQLNYYTQQTFPRFKLDPNLANYFELVDVKIKLLTIKYAQLIEEYIPEDGNSFLPFG